MNNYFCEKIFENYKNLIVGVSGGVDSIVLLHMLNNLETKYNLNIEIAHFNHKTRDGESDIDEKLVEKLAFDYNYKFHTKAESMDEYSQKMGISKEESGRILRHSFFNDIISKKINRNDWRIVLAHNKDDQVETVLMRIFRGTGLKGLEGMSIDDGKILRPLLNVSKESIRKYAKEHDLRFNEDYTNFENDYLRNKIRNIVIPTIKNEINPNMDESIIKLSNVAKSQNDYIKDVLINKFEDINSYETYEIMRFNKIDLRKFSEYEITEFLRMKIEKISTNYNFTSAHYREIIKIIESDRSVSTTINNIIFYNSFNDFIIRKKIKNDLANSFRIQTKKIEFNGYKVKISEKYINEFIASTRKNGDRINFNGKNIKLKDFFINKKIDKIDRDLIPIISYNHQIIAVGDIYISKDFKQYLQIERKE